MIAKLCGCCYSEQIKYFLVYWFLRIPTVFCFSFVYVKFQNYHWTYVFHWLNGYRKRSQISCFQCVETAKFINKHVFFFKRKRERVPEWKTVVSLFIFVFFSLQKKNVFLQHYVSVKRNINSALQNISFQFQHTISDRTRDSFLAFIKGIFYDECRVGAVDSDDIIKEYLGCGSWNREETNGEYENFTKSPEFQEMVLRVSKRLGFEENLNASIIETIYLECAFEKAW